MASIDYSDWFEGEPDNKDKDQDCLVNRLFNETTKFHWDDIGCTVNYFAKPLCQIFT